MSKEGMPRFEKPLEDRVETSREAMKSPDLKFYVTDHSPDTSETGNPEKLRELYADVKKDGIESIRYDWRWSHIERERGAYDEESLDRYGAATEVMKEAGLEQPTVILSNIPPWALELYKTDKEAFFNSYRDYAERVRDKLEIEAEKNGERVQRVQVLNELNQLVYTPIAPEDVGRVCQITREVFTAYNPGIKLLGTLFAGNLPQVAEKFGVKIATDINKYLDENEDMLRRFDALAIDYYPGTWHIPMKEARENNQEIFKQMGLLKEVMEKVASWGKEYEIGEVGLPTNMPFLTEKHNEDRQRYFYDVFFRSFKQLLGDFQERNIPLPTRVGLYEAMDEPPKNLTGKFLRKFTPFPEHDFGMRRENISRKEILKGNRHISGDERENQPSQLSNIIRYMNTSLKK